MSVSPLECFERFGLVKLELVGPGVALEAVFISPLLSGSEVFGGSASCGEVGFGGKLPFSGLGRQSQASRPHFVESTVFPFASEPGSRSVFCMTIVSGFELKLGSVGWGLICSVLCGTVSVRRRRAGRRNVLDGGP